MASDARFALGVPSSRYVQAACWRTQPPSHLGVIVRLLGSSALFEEVRRRPTVPPR